MECAYCGDEIYRVESTDVCTEDHEGMEDNGIGLPLHVDCPCPDHEWDGEREPFSDEQHVFN